MATNIKPTALETVMLMAPRAPKLQPNSLEARHGHFKKGAVLPETMAQVCPRVKVSDLPADFLKKNHIEALEQNQMIASCCRHPENHEVEACKSHPSEIVPDIYIFHCDKCNRKHRFFCVGMDDTRPSWKGIAA